MYNYVHIKDKVSSINKFTPSDREVVFMLRGLSRSYKGWLGAEEDLSEKYDIICSDLPGVGLSKNEKLLYNIGEMAEKFVEIINHLNLDKFYIVAPSLGSLVTYEIIQMLPYSKIAGIVILVPSHSGFGLKRLSVQGIRTLASAGFVSKEVKIAMLKELLVGRTEEDLDPFEDVHLERKWKKQLTQDNDELGTKGQLAQVIAAAKYASKKGLDKIKGEQIPLKVMIATHDRMIPISHKKVIYEYLKHPYSELIEMKNSGHDFIVTHKNKVFETIDKLISEKGSYPVRVTTISNVENNGFKSKSVGLTEKGKNKNIFFFFSTLFFGIMLMLAVNKYKKK